MHSNRLLHWSKILPSSFSGPHQEVRKGELMEKERKKGKERGRGKGKRVGDGDGERGGRERGGERKVKNLHITMPEKNQNIFQRKMGHFQILVPYQTN